MLRSRLLTASLLAPLLLAAIWLLPSGGVALLFGLVILLGAWEWARLIGVRAGALAFAGGLGLLMVASWIWQDQLPRLPLFWLSGLLWLGIFIWLLGYSRYPALRTPPRPLGGLIAYVVLWLAWFGFVAIHQQAAGPFFVSLLLFAVWGADIGAYFAGRAFGRRKLAPRISPNKTWEGLAGGVLLALVAGALMQLALGPARPPLGPLMLLLLPTVLISIVGDLFESMVKRQHGAKDSGTLLPGHGGVLDRIDSLTAAAPIFAMGLLWLQAL